jgi:hypothetical protein
MNNLQKELVPALPALPKPQEIDPFILSNANDPLYANPVIVIGTQIHDLKLDPISVKSQDDIERRHKVRSIIVNTLSSDLLKACTTVFNETKTKTIDQVREWLEKADVKKEEKIRILTPLSARIQYVKSYNKTIEDYVMLNIGDVIVGRESPPQYAMNRLTTAMKTLLSLG